MLGASFGCARDDFEPAKCASGAISGKSGTLGPTFWNAQGDFLIPTIFLVTFGRSRVDFRACLGQLSGVLKQLCNDTMLPRGDFRVRAGRLRNYKMHIGSTHGTLGRLSNALGLNF